MLGKIAVLKCTTETQGKFILVRVSVSSSYWKPTVREVLWLGRHFMTQCDRYAKYHESQFVAILDMYGKSTESSREKS